MSRSIDRSRHEREIVNRSRYGRYDARRICPAPKYGGPEPFAPKAPAQIPISVIDPHPYAHHPATETDIRAILTRLPAWTLSTPTEIHLRRGAEDDLKPARDPTSPSEVVDDWIGRRGYEVLPNIYCGRVLGQYVHRAARIHLYAFVYDPELPDRTMWEVLLRSSVLTTLVHEVSHHRWRYGNWPAGERPDSETFARQTAHAAVRQLIVPYLEEAYAADVDHLLSWIAGHVGVRLTLASLHPDREDSAASAFSGFTAGSAMEHLLESLSKGHEPRAIRLDFARNIHYGGKYDDAMRILASLLDDEPHAFEALDLWACILVDQHRLVEAQAFTHELTRNFPTRARAWDRRASVSNKLRDWDGVVEAVTAMIALSDVNERPHQFDDALISRARAFAELGQFDAALRDLNGVTSRVTGRQLKVLSRLRREIEAKQAAVTG